MKPLVEAGTALLVDVRIKPAYDAGHIPGAVHLAENSTPGQIEAFRAQHGTNQYVVAYCSSTSCSLSYRLAQKLARDYGFAKVDYMTGGYVEYQRETALAAGGSATASNSPPALTSGTAERTPLPISWTKAADWLKQGQAVLVDARPAADYAAGHLAGALSLPRHASAQELAAFGQRVGTNQIIVVYGERAGSLTALDLASRLTQELGVPAVRFLPARLSGTRPLARQHRGQAVAVNPPSSRPPPCPRRPLCTGGTLAVGGGLEAGEPDGLSRLPLRLRSAAAGGVPQGRCGGAAVARVAVWLDAPGQCLAPDHSPVRGRPVRCVRGGHRPGCRSRSRNRLRLFRPGHLRLPSRRDRHGPLPREPGLRVPAQRRAVRRRRLVVAPRPRRWNGRPTCSAPRTGRIPPGGPCPPTRLLPDTSRRHKRR
ncbi:MAG: rhodanese-like domain-containing protein [Verrucomicrobia bacterium]|nr:rhodanese-like domain-containing protein [Verrucomicrobiota bacterium]